MVDTFPGLFWGYTTIFGLMAVYLVYLENRISRIERKRTKDTGE